MRLQRHHALWRSIDEADDGETQKNTFLWHGRAPFANLDPAGFAHSRGVSCGMYQRGKLKWTM